MPTYNYYCPKCDIDWDVILPIEHQSPECPQCHNTFVKRCVTAASFNIKGFNAKNNYGLKGNK